MSKVLPILFNTEMVRAILDGRKTVTRRVVKPQPKFILCYTFAGYNNRTWSYPKDSAYVHWGEEYRLPDCITDDDKKMVWKPPYHADDILYVRETWTRFDCCSCEGDHRGNCSKEPDGKGGCYMYRASDEIFGDAKWHPSIHMPKEVARIWLKVKDVRVERLNDMKPEDVRKEGMHLIFTPKECKSQFDKLGAIYYYEEARRKFSKLWNSTIKKSDLDRYGWYANPWVWVIEFERCEKPALKEE